MSEVLFESPIEVNHPVFPAPSQELAAGILAEHGAGALAKLLKTRNDAIRAEQMYPLEYGFELPTWLLADVLFGFIDWPTFVRRIEQIAAIAWCPLVAEDLREWVADEQLQAAVAEGPYQLGLLLGGNQAGKTEWMLKRFVGHLAKFDKSIIWCFHESSSMSVDYHQTRAWHYLPDAWRNAGKGRIGYVSWKQQTGFSDYKMTGPNGSLGRFLNYEQREDVIEGGEVGDKLERRCLGWIADELLPLNWLKTLRFRLSRRSATGVVGFTPKYGYSDTVAWFLDGARMVRDEPGRELRSGDRVPLVRVGRADDESKLKKVIINFHSRYNPYPTRNSYANLVAMVREDNDATRAIRLYGHAVKTRQDLFPKLHEDVHGFLVNYEL